jgi:sugar phosphate permease
MHPTTANKSPGRSSLSESTALKAVFSKVDWRLIPLLLIAYMVAYLDRINIGYAQLQMKANLAVRRRRLRPGRRHFFHRIFPV